MIAPAVTFRALTEDDRERLFVWRNSPEVAPYMYTDHVITADEHTRWFAGIGADASRVYWIIEMDGGPVGLVNLYAIEADSCAWAYYLADPATRGRGLGSYVEYRMIEHVLGDRGLDRLWCEVLAENEAVWKLHLSFGFVREALLPGHVTKGGVALDVVRLGLTPDSWTKVRAGCADRLAARGFDLSAESSL